ncbi:hypothetical protein ABFX02_11G076000 [Erythranthe guttata]
MYCIIMGNKQLLQSFILLTVLVQSMAASEKIWDCWPVGHVYVTVTNELPENSPPLYLRCQSKNNDVGYQTVARNQEYKFNFCPNHRTLFFCHAWWNGKSLAFDVYRWKWCHMCDWRVHSDGIYQVQDYTNFVKIYNW